MMKKVRVILALTFVLCLICGAALADAHPVDEETGAYIHDYGVGEDESKVITWPTAGKNGLIRFPCAYAGEYEDEEAEGYLPAASDFQEYVVYPYDGEFPADWEEALALAAENPDRVAEYKPTSCKNGVPKEGLIVIKSGWYNEKKFQKLEYVDEIYFRGWAGKDTRTKSYTIPAGHKWSDDEQWAELRKELDKPQYHFIKEATCQEQGILRPYCLECDTERGDEVYTDPIDHTFDWVVTTPASCVAEGKEEYMCTMCGEPSEDENGESEHVLPIDPQAHVFGDWITESEKKPTCTEDGSLIQYRICKLCLDAKEVNETVLEALGHDFTIPVEIDTCVEHYITFLCSRCGEECPEDMREELEVDPTHHPLDHWKKTETQEPTCTEDGLEKYECDLCGLEGQTVLPALGHDLIPETEEFIPGHCGKTEDEEQADAWTYLCARCGETVTIEGDVPEHDWSEWTCRNEYNQGGLDTPAYWIRQCMACGKHQEEKRNDALDMNDDCDMNGHVADEAKTVVVPATCTKEGKITYTCERCGKTWSEVLPKIAHTVIVDEAVEATCDADGLTEGSHCSVCGETLVAQEKVPAAGHKYTKEDAVPATCTEKGKTAHVFCTVCGDEVLAAEEIPALGHEADEEKTVTVDPTCTKDGKTVYTCKACGKTWEEAIPATGHKEVKDDAVAATCEETGLTEGSHCEVCGEAIKAQEVIPALGHDWDEGKVTKEATPDADGEILYTCKVCGETKTEADPFVPTADPAYAVENVAKDGNVVTGNVVHDKATKTADELYVRVTFYMNDNTFISGVYDVREDGSFRAAVKGDVKYIGVEVVGSYEAVDPDDETWSSMGGTLIKVK